MPASFSALAPSEIVHRSSISGFTIRHPNVEDHNVSSPAAKPFAGLSSTHGARLIDSTPPATSSDASPHSIARAAWIDASRLEPHNRFTVTPGTDVGKPASSTAIRATSLFSSPAPFAFPSSTSSISAGSSAGTRSSSARSKCAARSSGLTLASAPP
jgi:hypothetical protein